MTYDLKTGLVGAVALIVLGLALDKFLLRRALGLRSTKIRAFLCVWFIMSVFILALIPKGIIALCGMTMMMPLFPFAFGDFTKRGG